MHSFLSGSALPSAYTLPRKVAALYIGQNSRSSGYLAELPQGAQVELCGSGYNERTLKIRLHGEYYIAFAQDLELDTVLPRY
jgi:hypothetical protein